jgi:hypothetical protein
MTTVIYALFTVMLVNGQPVTNIKPMDSELECKMAESIMRNDIARDPKKKGWTATCAVRRDVWQPVQ